MKKYNPKGPDKSEVFIEVEQTAVAVKEEYLKLIESTVMQCLKDEAVGFGCEINVQLSDDESIKHINKQFRGIDRPTDVLSFPMADFEEGKLLSNDGDFDMDEGLLLLGDIVISLETAEKQSAEYGHSFERELAFLTAHGVFHLLGYDHMEKAEETVMISKQEAVLEKMGYRRV